MRSSRLIPARAGSTAASSASPSTSGAHPRSRGEHTPEVEVPQPSHGSSPLARGAPRAPQAATGSGGLIPARAGSTTSGSSSRALATARAYSWAHPRSRGEHINAHFWFLSFRRSSPLARGARSALQVGRLLRGLIPARAGSTAQRPRWCGSLGAHPRSRGEHPRRV